MRDCIEAMRVGFRDWADGSAVSRPRMRYVAQHKDAERKYFANVHIGAVPSFGVAVVRAGSHIIKPPSKTVERRLYENPKPANSGIVVLYSMETAELIGLMHEFHLSGMRVGATSALAIDKIARPDASVFGLFGTGKQARAAFEAIALVRTFRRVNVFSPSREHREAFAHEMGRGGTEVVAAADPKAAVEGADVICCATSSLKPVFDGNWLEDGQLVVTIANSDVTNPIRRSEVDRRTYERAHTIIVTDWESVVDGNQLEILEPIAEGLVSRDIIHELKDVVADRIAVKQTSRTDAAQGVIYYKNNAGVALQFAAAGGLVYQRALAEGKCKMLPSELFETDLSAQYAAGYRPSP
jgi:ornithine cyclodeaminase/alanine dehydrogenase-like protein (mu-crystallin family)